MIFLLKVIGKIFNKLPCGGTLMKVLRIQVTLAASGGRE